MLPRRIRQATKTAAPASPISAAPDDERQRLHPGVVGEPRQRTERPEQGRGHDDDDEARDGRAILGRHGDMVGPMPATGRGGRRGRGLAAA